MCCSHSELNMPFYQEKSVQLPISTKYFCGDQCIYTYNIHVHCWLYLQFPFGVKLFQVVIICIEIPFNCEGLPETLPSFSSPPCPCGPSLSHVMKVDFGNIVHGCAYLSGQPLKFCAWFLEEDNLAPLLIVWNLDWVDLWPLAPVQLPE